MLKNKKIALKVNNISKTFGNKELFKDVSFSLFFGEKIGIVGPNGSGKSTMMKIVTGVLEKDSGSIEIFKNLNISYVPQELGSEQKVKSYVFGENESLFHKEHELVSKKFGLDSDIFLKKIYELSGGQKTKVFLMKIYLDDSQIIVLDEPTNNLDSEGLELLSEIVNNSKSAFLIISHNRSFLDEAVSKIIEIDQNKKDVSIYDGSYSNYIVTKNKEIERQNTLFSEFSRNKKKMEKDLAQRKEKASRNLAGKNFSGDPDKMVSNYKKDSFHSTNAAKVNAIKKSIDLLDEKQRVPEKRPLKIDFSNMEKIGSNILKVEDFSLMFGVKKIINLEVFSGDRLFVSGVNGSGKTTFLKTILGLMEGVSGKYNWTKNAKIGYLPQDFLSEGVEDKIFLEYFMNESGKNESDSRKILFRFGFKEEEVKRKIDELSPGLRGRGRIALMMANNPNVLTLDEPTNNLDLEVLEKFEQELVNYPGTIIFTSHDKTFVKKMKPNKYLKL